MRRSLWVFVWAILPAAHAFAQLSQGYLTDFENNNPPWSFQYLSESVRWKIDSSPVSFTSPSNTLNQIDSSSGVQEVGDTEGYSPTAFFGGSGKRYISFWCRFFPISIEHGTRRSMKIGSNLFTESPVFVVFFDDNSTTNNGATSATCPGTDAPDGATLTGATVLLTCGDPNGWHQHIFEIDDPATDIFYTGPGFTKAPSGSTAVATAAQQIHDKIVMQGSFHYQQSFEPGNCPPAGSGPPRWGCQGWLIDDFKLLVTQTDPFAPDPSKPSAGGGKGGGFKCLHEPLTESTTGPMPVALFAVLALAGACIARRRMIG